MYKERRCGWITSRYWSDGIREKQPAIRHERGEGVRAPQAVSLDVGALELTDVRFPADLRIPDHDHARPIFAVLLDGSMDVEFARRGFHCEIGTVQVHPPGERHRQCYHGAGARIVVIEPDTEALEPLGSAASDLLSTIANFRHGALFDLARKLARELRHPDSVTPLAAEALSLEMLVRAARTDERQRLAEAAPNWLEQAREIVHAAFLSNLRINDVAAAVDVHPGYLARRFRSHFHVPMGAYIRRMRLDWAAEQLLETDEPIGRIALRAGFSDQSHFTRVFRRYAGQTPARYRRHRSRHPG